MAAKATAPARSRAKKKTTKQPAKRKVVSRRKKDILLPIDQWIAEAKAEMRRRRREAKKRPPRTLLEIVEHARRHLTQEDLDRSPGDGSYNLDHYLYGAPKKTLRD